MRACQFLCADEGYTTLKFDCFHFADEARCVAFQEGTYNIEDRVTETADIQDIGSLGCLSGSVGLQIDADQLRLSDTVPTLDLLELFPLRHHSGRAVTTVAVASARRDPAFVVTYQHHARESPL